MKKTPEQLCNENQGLIHFVANKYFNVIGNMDSASYHDLVSDCNYALLKASLTFDDSKGCNFATYAISILHNEVRQTLRRYKASNRIPQDLCDTEAFVGEKNGVARVVQVYDVLESKDDIEELIEQKLMMKYVLDKLKEDKKLYKLYCLFDAGYTQVEIARIMGFKQPHISRLRKKLQNKVMKIMGEYKNGGLQQSI